MAEQEEFKRNIAFKLRIGEILEGKPMFDGERFRCVESDNKQVVRTNIIANIIDKYVQEGEKKFASVTLDDASGQIKVKVFGEDTEKFKDFNQGDTIQLIGILRSWNNELYILPEIIKKREPTYLLVRKLERDIEQPKTLPPEQQNELKDKIISFVKAQEENGGAEVETMILELKSSPNSINGEIKKLLEEGIIYEPRPGKIRYLG